MTKKFIVIEGVDGSGKSTLIRNCKEKLTGIEYVRMPGFGELGKKLREILLVSKDHLSFETERFLFAADHANCIDFLNNAKELSEVETVISDRSSFISEQVYGLYGHKTEDKWEKFVVRSLAGLQPRVERECYLFVIRVSDEVLEQRLKDLVPDRFNSKDVDFFRRINHIYNTQFFEWRRYGFRKLIELNGEKATEEVFEDFKRELDKL